MERPTVTGEPAQTSKSKTGLLGRLFKGPSKPPAEEIEQVPRSDLSEFDNPIYRYEFLKNASEEKLSEVCDAFMDGNWYVFGVWAALALGGKLPPQGKRPDTPHGRFWESVLGAPAQDRDEFLNFLLRSGLADTGIRYRQLREAPPMPSKASLGILKSYLGTFMEPSHSAKEKAHLGSRLVWYGNYPEERMVRLAPLLSEEALPDLERFLTVRRRFYKLHTDYTTELEELDNLFLESVKALQEIGSDAKMKEHVGTILRRVLEGLRKESKKLAEKPSILSGNGQDSEVIWVESYHDHMGNSPSTVDVGQGTIPDVFSSGRGPMSKIQWLELAVSALEGDAKAKKKILDGGTWPRKEVELPGAQWMFPVDDGAGRIAGDRLFYMANFLFDGTHHLPTLSSIHIPTGKTRFMLNLGDRSSSRGLKVWGGTFLLAPDGHPVLMTQLDREKGPRPYTLISFDAGTGQVSSMQPLAVEPDKEAALLSVTEEGYILIRDRLVWKQSKDGSLLWKTELPKSECFEILGERAIVLTEDELVLMDLANPKKVLRRPREELAKEAGGGFQPDLLLRRDGFYLFDNNRTIYSFTNEGKFLGKHADKDDAWLGMPKLWGEGLSFVNFKKFCLIAPDGTVAHEFPTPERPREYLVDGKDVLYFTDSALWYWNQSMKEAKKAIEAPINHMAKPLGVFEGRLLLLFYSDHYYMAAVDVKGL